MPLRLATTVTGIDISGTVTATGTSVFASLDISGDIDVDGTTNLDVVDIDGAVDMASTVRRSLNRRFLGYIRRYRY
jgi:cytoskeletal protein CcmA (bactofilin family)